MAEKHLEDGKDGCVSAVEGDNHNEVISVKQTPKRRSSTSPSAAPPHKSPRSDSKASPTTQTSDGGEGQSERDRKEMQSEDTEDSAGPSVSPTPRRKSWRRSTITRRSLPALPNPYQALCRNISTSLSQHERLEKLMDASMKVAIERTQNLLQSMPNTSLESFEKQVEHIQKEWGCLAKRIDSEQHQLPPSEASKPAMQGAMEKVQRAINRLQAESESWEALLNKHRSKAEELERKVEQGQKTGVSLGPTPVTQSSQHLFIQSKPDYHVVLCRQQPKLQTMGMIMDTQCKMVRELLSIKEHSQLLVKETSGRLAAEEGFQDLSSDLLRNLMAAPLSSATT
ncbi:kinetochore-associated protein DSN1 homolog [Amphiprion ocellaris]|uniref:DSN1 component of MIS12 kinetochore complex n=1 Tax=Amphiprion ocellaris TaxID=80972 RepID=A0A3Q1AL36_AMPOC|nr:kinetochore-associated protein DSN1 homolog [Amphiprion ocellaris]